MGSTSVLRKDRARTSVDSRETTSGGICEEKCGNEGRSREENTTTNPTAATIDERKTQNANCYAEESN